MMNRSTVVRTACSELTSWSGIRERLPLFRRCDRFRPKTNFLFGGRPHVFSGFCSAGTFCGVLRGFFQHAVCRPPGSHGPGRGLPGFLRTWSRCTCPPHARVPPSGGTSRDPNAASPSGWQGGGAEGPWRPRGTGGGGRGGVCGCLRSRNVLEIRPRPTSPPPDRANAPFILLKETHLPVARCEREVGP